MTVARHHLVLDAADAFMACHQIGATDDVLAEFALRLDLAGAGDVLTDLTGRVCWAADHGAGAPGCRCHKKPPDPKPIPPPPPPKPGK